MRKSETICTAAFYLNEFLIHLVGLYECTIMQVGMQSTPTSIIRREKTITEASRVAYSKSFLNHIWRLALLIYEEI